MQVQSTDRHLGKTMESGLRKTRTADRSSRSGLEMSISRSRYFLCCCRPCSKLTFTTDGQNWLARRCHRVIRSRGSKSLLLFGAGSEGFGLLIDILALQDQADMNHAAEGDRQDDQSIASAACISVTVGLISQEAKAVSNVMTGQLVICASPVLKNVCSVTSHPDRDQNMLEHVSRGGAIETHRKKICPATIMRSVCLYLHLQLSANFDYRLK